MGGGPAWDALQAGASGARDVVVAAFQEDPGSTEVTLRPVGLRPSSQYDVVSVDTGLLGNASGADLMADGVSLLESSHSAAHIIVLRLRRMMSP